MRTVLFAIIITNIAFDTSMSFSSKTYKNIFADLSTAIVTYVELKDVSSLKGPSYIKRLINEENTVFSPIDIHMTTSLLLIGAKGSTKNELMYFLDITDDVSSFSNIFRPEFTYLNDNKNIELYLGNAIYVQKSVDLTINFLSLCMNEFNCSISKIDFRNNIQAAETINSRVQKTTNNKILHIISPDNIDKDTKIMLVNTVYFNIGWPNLKGKIEKRKFYLSPSKVYLVPTIKFEKSTFIHGEIPHWNAKFIEIPVLNANVIMIIFLPNEEMEPGNLEYLKEKFDFEEFKSIRTAYTNKFEQDMELYLPKFTSEYHRNMTHFFHDMNINMMFENNADFTHLSKIPLKVNNIVQTISVKINEGSLEAPHNDKNKIKKPVGLSQKLIVDRPFYYIIEMHGEIMSSGVMRTPDFMFKDEL